MSLPPGTRFGAYEVVEMLGAGGMGEVYRARDKNLNRDVALKLLPRQFTADAERRARFQREARLLASLNHPHIASIYGSEEGHGMTALVLELVEGPTLAERLQQGALPIEEALDIARQIAEALDAAHARGIVHRDIKPANILLLANSGPGPSQYRAKVLDFGISKMEDLTTGDNVGTATSPATAAGHVVGTPAYMSPEQARGMPVDKRTDIWSFGCVLFEMLSGTRAFAADTVTDTFVRVLEHAPNWAGLPQGTPAPVRTLIERCLRKDRRRRLHDIADALIEIEESANTPPSFVVAHPAAGEPSRTVRAYLPWIASAVLAAALVAVVLFAWVRRPGLTPTAEVVQFAVLPPENSRFSGTAPEFAMSPDGRNLAFTASHQGVSMLWVRSLDSVNLRMIPGTEGAQYPFWKSDSRSVGFMTSEGALKTIRVDGGAPVVLAVFPTTEIDRALGAWSANDVIVFGPRKGVLHRISAAGGSSEPVTSIREGDARHRWPVFLPDATHFFYLAQRSGADELRIGGLDGTDQPVGQSDSHGEYAGGYLFYVRSHNLMAHPFDVSARRLTGDAQVVTQADVDAPWQHGMFSLATTGRLAYCVQARTPSVLRWLDRRGKSLEAIGEPGVFFNLDLSPDGNRLAISRMTQSPGSKADFDIWLLDLTRDGAATRLTDDPAWEFDPAWSNDGKHIAFNSNRPDPLRDTFSLFVRPLGSSADRLLAKGGPITAPAWSADGHVVYSYRSDLWVVDMADHDPKAQPFLESPYAENSPVFSADGKWVAYHSNASGRQEVYVRRFPRADTAFQVSKDGGYSPRWRQDGKELFFLALDGSLMTAEVVRPDPFAAAVPKRLFGTLLRPGNNRMYDVSSNGERFLVSELQSGAPINVLLNWPALVFHRDEARSAKGPD